MHVKTAHNPVSNQISFLNTVALSLFDSALAPSEINLPYETNRFKGLATEIFMSFALIAYLVYLKSAYHAHTWASQPVNVTVIQLSLSTEYGTLKIKC